MRRQLRASETRVLFWQLIARFPAGMMTIGLLTWAEWRFESYAYGGVLVAAFTLGFAVGSSLSTRLFRTLGSTPVLRVGAVLSFGCMMLLAYVQWDFPAAVALAALIGLTFPPVTPLARSLYPRLSSGPKLMRVYSLDAIAQEGIWVLSPMLAVGIAGALGPSQVIGICGVFVLVGTLGFSWLKVLRTHDARGIAPGAGASGSVPRAVVGFFLIGFFLVASGAFIEVYALERFGYESPLSGLVLALISVGSIVGGLTFARQNVNRYSLAFRMMFVTVGLTVAALAPSFSAQLIGLFLSGAGIAPSFTAMHARIAIVVPQTRAAEIYAFVNTMQLFGLSAGSALAGALVTAVPGEAVLLAGAASVLVATMIALILGRLDRR